QVDIYVCFVGSSRNRCVDPRDRRMRHDDLQMREIGGNIIEQYRIRVTHLDATTARQASAYAGLTCMEQSDNAMRLENFEKRVKSAVIRFESLKAGVKLHSPHTILCGKSAGALDGVVSVRIYRTERNQNVTVL